MCPAARPGPFRLWWMTIRPATLWAGAAPVFVGAALAVRHGEARPLLSGLALLGSILIQIGCNLVNDYSDFERGADKEDRLGPARAAAQGWLTVGALRRAAILSLSAAGLVGAYLISVGGWPIAALGVASLIAAVAYTAGPYPLAYLGLGDLFVLLFFGLGAVAGTYYLHLHTLPIEALLAGGAVGALATAILVVNNLRDRESDARAEKRTLAVRFGDRFARLEYLALSLGAYGLVAWEGLIRGGGVAWLCPLITFPLCFRLCLRLWRSEGAALNPLLGETARLELLFSLSLAGGLLWL